MWKLVNAQRWNTRHYIWGRFLFCNNKEKREKTLKNEVQTTISELDSSRITKAKKEDILNQLDEFLKDK